MPDTKPFEKAYPNEIVPKGSLMEEKPHSLIQPSFVPNGKSFLQQKAPIREKPSIPIKQSKGNSLRTGRFSSIATICSRRSNNVRPPMTRQSIRETSKYIFLRLRILLSRIIIQIIAQKQISVFFSKHPSLRVKQQQSELRRDSQPNSPNEFCFLRSNQNRHIHIASSSLTLSSKHVPLSSNSNSAKLFPIYLL